MRRILRRMRMPVQVPAVCLAALSLHVLATEAHAQTATYDLTSTTGLRLQNVTAEPATLSGRRGVRITFSEDARQRIAALPIAEQSRTETFALIDGLEFSNGVIEAEISGDLAKDAPEGARGFVGIAFRVRPDMATYDAFYLRPTNGRADDLGRWRTSGRCA
jgi:hypothetical protein